MDYGQIPNFKLGSPNLSASEWAAPVKNEHDRRALGGSAIGNMTPEKRPDLPDFTNPESAPVLGQITSPLPPGYQESTLNPDITAQDATPADASLVTLRQKAKSHQKFTPADAKIVDAVISDFEKTGDISNLYEQIRTDDSLATSTGNEH